MKQVSLALVAEDPFPIARYGYPTRTAREVPQFQDREFYGSIHGYKNGHLGNDAILSVFKYAIAEAMPDNVGCRPGCRQRCWRPKVPAMFVADVKGFSSGVRNRIVIPRRQTKLVRILRPGIATAALRNDCAERGVGDHIYPGDRRCLSRLQCHDVFTTVGSKATQAIMKNEFALSKGLRRIAQGGLARCQRGD